MGKRIWGTVGKLFWRFLLNMTKGLWPWHEEDTFSWIQWNSKHSKAWASNGQLLLPLWLVKILTANEWYSSLFTFFHSVFTKFTLKMLLYTPVTVWTPIVFIVLFSLSLNQLMSSICLSAWSFIRSNCCASVALKICPWFEEAVI